MLKYYCGKCDKLVTPVKTYDEIIDETVKTCPNCGKSLDIDDIEYADDDDC